MEKWSFKCLYVYSKYSFVTSSTKINMDNHIKMAHTKEEMVLYELN